MAKLIISPLARADMLQIGDYISRELRNPGAAHRLIQDFRKTMLPLREFPEMGTPLAAGEKYNIRYRYLVCGNYLIFYHTGSNNVYIDRILYGRSDYLAVLFCNPSSE